MNNTTKQTREPSITNRLIDFVKKIPQGEQHALLSELEERFLRLKRKHKRKAINSDVECVTNNHSRKGVIKNISAGGVFIETLMPFRCGKDVVLKFMFPHKPPKQFEIEGNIVRITPFGVGVRFKHLSKDQELFITSYC